MLFRKSEEKKAQEEAAQAEINRLQALSPDELAVEVLPALGSETLKQKITGVRVQAIIKEMLGGFGGSMSVNTGLLLFPVREALQRLEHANLIMQMASSVDQATNWRITTAGEEALAAGDVARRLGVGAA